MAIKKSPNNSESDKWKLEGGNHESSENEIAEDTRLRSS